MDKKLFDSLDESVKEKLRNCKSEAEMQKIIAEAGLQELSPEMLEGVSGGKLLPYGCSTKTDTSGRPCYYYIFE